MPVLIRRRPDGNPIKVPGFTKLMPMLIGSRTQSTIFFEVELHLDRTIDFMQTYNTTRKEGMRRLSVFQIFLCAFARITAEKPKINRFIMNYRYYQRNHITAALVTKTSLHEDAEEVNVMIPLDPDETIRSINEKFTAHVNNIKTGGSNTSNDGVDIFGKLPASMLRFFVWIYKFLDNHNLTTRGMLRAFPFYATVFATHLGSIQLDSALHHLFDMGTNGIFAALGLLHKETYLDHNATPQSRKTMKINFSFDERIVDGLYAGNAMRLMKKYVENPELLTTIKTTSEAERREIGLTAKGSKIFL
jgi:hypothetical protein